MKRALIVNIAIILLLVVQLNSFGMSGADIVPHPSKIYYEKGDFLISANTTIYVANPELIPLAGLLQKKVQILSGIQLKLSKDKTHKKIIKLQLEDGVDAEGYQLIISDNISIVATNYDGIAQGLASLTQLMIPISNGIKLHKLKILDKPDFSYRAVMLDLARFWQPVETIKETIDLLWFYKIRFLQLHLSDNSRFTFPLDDYPELKRVNNKGSREYYTLGELRDLVEYAKQRGVAIIPEIELPGHSSQLWQKYPETFGSVDAVTKKSRSLYVVNMAKEVTYKACEKIIQKLADVFYTSPYINLGGDEVYLEAMKNIPEYKTFCESHHLNAALNGDADELFCYFINRMDQIVKSTGKKSIVWEGFHGTGTGSQTISKDIEVIVWNTTYNHPDSLRENGYQIINSTWIPWYMVGAMNLAAPQEVSYRWDVTKWAHWNQKIKDITLNSKIGIMGGQICYWEQNHYMVVPILQERIPVLSERLWNNMAPTNFVDFKNRYANADALYNKLFHPVRMEVSNLLSKQDFTFMERARISLTSEVPGIIKYIYSDSWDMPDMKIAMQYVHPFEIKKSGVLTFQMYDKEGKTVGFPVQCYFQKIQPAYKYKVFRGSPQNGWTAMPDFSKLPLIRDGFSGFMTPERLEKINGELFAKVKKEGHIETRFSGIYNPYALELKGKIVIPGNSNYVFRIQTNDGLAELYIDDQLVGKGKTWKNEPEDFMIKLEAGNHPFTIKYFYKQIQNQLSILYKTEDMSHFEPFEKIVEPIKFN